MKYDDFQVKVGRRIRELRETAGITQENMEYMDGEDHLTVRGYQEIERGKGNPRLKSLFIIAKQLGVRPDELLDVN